jgi:hypothetical protein
MIFRWAQDNSDENLLDQVVKDVSVKKPVDLEAMWSENPNLGDKSTSLSRDSIMAFIGEMRAEGFSDNALRWGMLAARTQSTDQGGIEPGAWLRHNIYTVMEWIDGAGISPLDKSLADFSTAVKMAKAWKNDMDLVERAKDVVVPQSRVVYRFPDGWFVASIDEDSLEYESSFIKTTNIYMEGPDDAIYAIKDNNGVTRAIAATHGNIGSERIDVREADHSSQQGQDHLKAWFAMLVGEGRVLSNTSDSSSEYEPKSAIGLGEELLDDYGLPRPFALWGGNAEAYAEQIHGIISDCEVETYDINRCARESMSNLISLATQSGQLKNIEDGLAIVEDQCFTNFLSYVDDGMQNKYPVEEDYEDKAQYEADLKAYDDERDEIESSSGWRRFCNRMYSEIQEAIKYQEKIESRRKKAWLSTRKRMKAAERAKAEKERIDKIVNHIDESSGQHGQHGWYGAGTGVSAAAWASMIREAKTSIGSRQ